jgi:membrane-bound acyltransferase YfiQ involved in biofilm formation
LLGPMFETGQRFTFLRRRLEKILLPWFAWFTAAVTSLVLRGLLRHRFSLGLNIPSLHVLGSSALTILTSTSYWFVPNLFLSTCLLLMMRKHMRSLWLGGSLLLVSLFYAVNLYADWIPTSHATALGGYVFFLWLGNLCSRHYRWLSAQLSKLSFSSLISMVIALLLLSFLESNVIRRLAVSDPGNTLRISNQVYSVAVALLIMKLKSSTWPRFVDVRNNLFGVYLTHWIILFKVLAIGAFVADLFPALRNSHGQLGSLMRASILTVITFSMSIGITKLLRCNDKLGWLVGDLSMRNRTPRGAEVPENIGVLTSGRAGNDAAQLT